MKPGCCFMNAASDAQACCSWSASSGSTVKVLIRTTDLLVLHLLEERHVPIHLNELWHLCLPPLGIVCPVHPKSIMPSSGVVRTLGSLFELFTEVPRETVWKMPQRAPYRVS